ncbi:hypothetical protein Dimus_028746 [Dionaea muscipula]
MADSVGEEIPIGRWAGLSTGQRCQSGEALAEWRSSEQVENGIPSTSPPYWDTDDSDDDGGPKPSELYGKHTWRIEKFSQINKRELRSNAFEVGGYKWYILIYPQGCDVCNHLSLFLCVANHDKLLPGWSHFAQFTLAVVNKDPKKSKHSDTLHRFWKKEHDWGWKKFMELSKVSDGFVDADTLIIRAQVQVIREKADRPFRCLDCQYRRELVRVYLTNVEQICRRFVEERRVKLKKLLDDKARWSSFCAFWLGIDQNSRRRMSKEKMDMILKVIVKQFFIEKEVTSTLVMDSLYSGLKALQGQSKSKKVKGKLLTSEDTPPPIIRVEKDMFVLVDDVLSLLRRAESEPLPPKDEKGPQNRTKDGSAGEDFNKESIERDERRLTELGRRTVEIFVLAHIFSNRIEVAYQEAVALKRQEELIREEEAAWLAESEQKAKRALSEKEKKLRKKQGKQKRNSRKGKDKAKDEIILMVQDKQLYDNPVDEKTLVELETRLDKDDTLEDASDISDSVDGAADVHHPDSDDRDASPVNWDADTSEVHPLADTSGREVGGSISTVSNGIGKRSSSVMDDSSSTTSTDSASSVAPNGSYRGNSFTNSIGQKSPIREKNLHSKVTCNEASLTSEADGQPSVAVGERYYKDVSASGKVTGSNEHGSVGSSSPSLDRTRGPDQHLVKKEDEIMLLQRKPGSRDHVNMERVSKEKAPFVPYSPRSPPRRANSPAQLKSDMSNPAVGLSLGRKTSAGSTQQTEKATLYNSQQTEKEALSSPQKTKKAALSSPQQTEKAPLFIETISPKPPEKHSVQPPSVISRPSSAPLIPGSKPVMAPGISIVQAVPTAPLLSRSVSAAGRLGPDPPGSRTYIPPPSYRNAIMGTSGTASPAGFGHPQPVSSTVTPSPTFSQQPTMISAPIYLHRGSDGFDSSSISQGIPFGSSMRDIPQTGCHWMDGPQRHISRSMTFDSSSSSLSDRQILDLVRHSHSSAGTHTPIVPPSEFSVSTSGRHAQGAALVEEFPHLDIINDLLDDEQQSSGSTSIFRGMNSSPNLLNHRFKLSRDLGIPGDLASLASSCRFEQSPSYQDDGFQLDYGSSGDYDSLQEYIPRANLMPYTNGHIDSLVPHPWQVAPPDLSLLNLRNSGSDGYQHNVHKYSNMGAGLNGGGYTMFRPSNGH